MFKNYIFDLYGTLVDIYTCEDSSELWEKTAIYYGYRGADYKPSELRRRYKALCKEEKALTKKAYPEFAHIDINLTNVFRRLYEEKGVEATGEITAETARFFRCTSTEYIRLYKGVEDLLITLRDKGRKVFLLSNAQSDFTRPEIKLLGLEKYFDDIIISSEVHTKKPDAKMYDILFERNNLIKEESVMIGNDFLADIKSAHDYGIRSLYIHQKISPEITGELLSNWKIMSGNVRRIKALIVKD